MLERLELGNFERILFITLFALIAAVFNLGVRLRAAPGASADSGGSFTASYNSPITDNLFSAQEIKPLDLVPVSEPTSQTTQATSSTPAPQQSEQFKQSQQNTTRNSILKKLL